MNETYFRVRLSHVSTPLEQEVTQLCFSHRALGISEVLSFSQPDLTYDPSLISRRQLDLDVFFENKPPADFFSELQKNFSDVRVSTSEEENKDWLSEWKKGFVPFKLVGKTWVVPSWLEKPSEAEHEVRIDPGMAFGTGTHATTKMASYFVHKLATENSSLLQNWSLLDVGTGTAILAILAEKLGYALVTGVEIDVEARRKARENCELNKTTHVEIIDKQIDEISDQYDVVVANIIDGVLIKIQKDLLKVTRSGGHLFLTGILQERDNHFFSKFIENNSLKVIKRIQKDEWVGYWVQKV